MSINTTGAEWKRFYADPIAWPDGSYHDDVLALVDGKHEEDADLGALKDHARIEIKSGYVMFGDGRDVDLVEHFSKWQSEQTMCSGAFTAPKEKMAEIHAAIVAAGGVVLG